MSAKDLVKRIADEDINMLILGLQTHVADFNM